jgi:hypothetical protein
MYVGPSRKATPHLRHPRRCRPCILATSIFPSLMTPTRSPPASASDLSVAYDARPAIAFRQQLRKSLLCYPQNIDHLGRDATRFSRPFLSVYPVTFLLSSPKRAAYRFLFAVSSSAPPSISVSLEFRHLSCQLLTQQTQQSPCATNFLCHTVSQHLTALSYPHLFPLSLKIPTPNASAQSVHSSSAALPPFTRSCTWR